MHLFSRFRSCSAVAVCWLAGWLAFLLDEFCLIDAHLLSRQPLSAVLLIRLPTNSLLLLTHWCVLIRILEPLVLLLLLSFG